MSTTQPVYDRYGNHLGRYTTADVVDIVDLHHIMEQYDMVDYYTLVSGRPVEKIYDDNECTYTPAYDSDGVLIGVIYDEKDPWYHPSQEHDYYAER